MSEKTRRIFLFSVLILAIVWAGFNYPFGGRRDTARTSAVVSTPAPPATASEKPVPGGSAADMNPRVSAAQIAQLEERPWPGDPFYQRRLKISARRAQARRQYFLKAIIYKEASPSAYINGRVVKTGDVIGDAKVIKIAPNTVTLRVGREYQRLTLK